MKVSPLLLLIYLEYFVILILICVWIGIVIGIIK